MDKLVPPVTTPPASTRTVTPTNRPTIQVRGVQIGHKYVFEHALRRASSEKPIEDADRTVRQGDQSKTSPVKEDALDDAEKVDEELRPRDPALLRSGMEINGRRPFDDTDDSLCDDGVSAQVGETSLVSQAGAGLGAQASGATEATPSAFSGPFTIQSVADLMTRLERQPGAHNGSWSFGVLNDAAGVTAMQLQRSLHGGWRVNVSMSEQTLIDGRQQAEDLKAALTEQGHDVDSVYIHDQSDTDDD